MVLISIIRKIFESIFLINLYRDTNIIYILYKLNQTCGIYKIAIVILG